MADVGTAELEEEIIKKLRASRVAGRELVAGELAEELVETLY